MLKWQAAFLREGQAIIQRFTTRDKAVVMKLLK